MSSDSFESTDPMPPGPLPESPGAGTIAPVGAEKTPPWKDWRLYAGLGAAAATLATVAIIERWRRRHD